MFIYDSAAPECKFGKKHTECGIDCGHICGGEGFGVECDEVRCVDGCFCPEGKSNYFSCHSLKY